MAVYAKLLQFKNIVMYKYNVLHIKAGFSVIFGDSALTHRNSEFYENFGF